MTWVDGGDFCWHEPRHGNLEACDAAAAPSVPGTPIIGPCPECGGRLRQSPIDPDETSCMDCTYASYDDADQADPQEAWDLYAADAGEDQAEHYLGPRPGPGRRRS